MGRVKIEITTDSAAFDDCDIGNSGREVARILRDISNHINGGQLLEGERILRDINGNRVGYYQYTPNFE